MMTEITSNSITVNSIKVQAVLFDLDGTLVDTAKDFVRIIHDMAQENNWQAPIEDIIREQVSAGSQAMVSLFRLSNNDLSNNERISDEQISDGEILQLKQQFLERYEADICVDSCLFAGLSELLNELESRHILWGIVTNKPRYLSEKLLTKLDLIHRCSVLVCPDDVANPKPDPEPMYLAMEKMGLNKKSGDTVKDIGNDTSNNIIYIGDHMRDIQAGNNANMITIVAGYGYISADERMNLKQWGADHIVDTPESLVDVLLELIDQDIG